MTRANTTNLTRLGNTRSRSWFFTFNNYKEIDIVLLLTQITPCISYIFQEELGEKKTKHLQGCLKYKNAKTFSSMKKLNKNIHWEVCKNFKNSVNYCNKNDTKNGKQWKFNVDHLITTKITFKMKNENLIKHISQFKIKVLEKMREDLLNGKYDSLFL